MLSTKTIPQSPVGPALLAATVPNAPQTTLEIAGVISIPALRMPFARNEELFGAEEPADFVYQVISGVVRTLRLLDDGRRQIISFHFAGELFGLEGGAVHTVSAEAVSDCEIVLARRSLVERAAGESPIVAHALWLLAVGSLRQAQQHMTLLGRCSARERVEAFLSEMATRGHHSEAVDLAMSRTDIADYLGLTIETVSRTLSQMERRRVIALPRSRRVVLRDRGAFADAA
jgi:CRP/FNR family nitrogen fixation transcriptional regulator